MRKCAMVALSVVALAAAGYAQPPHSVILVTLDGARIEEMFGGLDTRILESQLQPGERLQDHPLYQRYWAPTPEARREKLLPFFWGTLMREHGSIAGNPATGSRVHLANRHWFSYPGYFEILVGRADDELIKSNAAVQSPTPTVLEFLQSSLALDRDRVAAFASWKVLGVIVEHTAGALTVNAGYNAFDSPSPDIRRDSAEQFLSRTPFDTVRRDEFTFRFAMDHLARRRPRVLYLALGETDDWAHDGRYDEVLDAYSRTDRYLKHLWQWLQTHPDYRDRTSMLITTDHGRGRTPGNWRHHGESVAESGEGWMAFVTPLWPRRGEWRGHPPITASQAASTLIAWMGGDWQRFAGAAAPVQP